MASFGRSNLRRGSGDAATMMSTVTKNHILGGSPFLPPANLVLWTLPCREPVDLNGACVCDLTSTYSRVLSLPPGTYDVTLRIRGFVEFNAYIGGTNDGEFWQIGGDGGGQNTYAIVISSPAQTYYINRVWGSYSTDFFGARPIDYVKVVQMDAGATISLVGDSTDGYEQANPSNYTVTDDDPTFPILVSQPYDGQFAQLDATAVI